MRARAEAYECATDWLAHASMSYHILRLLSVLRFLVFHFSGHTKATFAGACTQPPITFGANDVYAQVNASHRLQDFGMILFFRPSIDHILFPFHFLSNTKLFFCFSRRHLLSRPDFLGTNNLRCEHKVTHFLIYIFFIFFVEISRRSCVPSTDC